MTITRRQTPAPYGQRRLSSDRAAMTIGDNIGSPDDNPRQPSATIAPSLNTIPPQSKVHFEKPQPAGEKIVA
jgi:hypothetical protein